jgi:predicted dienelactone hydrolase
MPTPPRRSATSRHAAAFRSLRWLALLLLISPVAAPAAATSGVGLAPIQVKDPVSGAEFGGFVFYPSTRPVQGTTAVGSYDVAAAFELPAQPGAKPLVVISHGNGGTRLGHHDLATWLAGHGFMVATLEHPADNFRDQSGVGTARVLAGRPLQVSAVITALLADARWKPLIDPARIGVAGFSAGGYTSLLVVGAQPRFERIFDYCVRHPKDEVFCQFSTREGLTPELKQRLAELNEGLTRWGPTSDPRVKAAFAMAPLSLFFDEPGAASIHGPVFLAYSEQDHVLLPEENARHLKPLLKTLAGVRVVPRADHWVFIPPCSKALARDAAEICTDPPGVDRARVHAQLNADALAFFRKALATKRP